MRVIVLLSGGLDSATLLAHATAQKHACYALSIDYGQRHSAELNAAAALCARYDVIEHRTVMVNYGQFGGSALTDESVDVPVDGGSGIPVTYVPARNTVMLAIALGWAEVLAAQTIYVGVNAVDYSGYPDCRPEFIAAFQKLADVATKAAIEGNGVNIEAPLIDLSKAQIIQRGTALGLDYASTVSCYQADEAGRGCGACDACRLRRQGFDDAGIADPTRYQ